MHGAPAYSHFGEPFKHLYAPAPGLFVVVYTHRTSTAATRLSRRPCGSAAVCGCRRQSLMHRWDGPCQNAVCAGAAQAECISAQAALTIFDQWCRRWRSACKGKGTAHTVSPEMVVYANIVLVALPSACRCAPEWMRCLHRSTWQTSLETWWARLA